MVKIFGKEWGIRSDPVTDSLEKNLGNVVNFASKKLLIRKLDKFTDNLIGVKAELARLFDEGALVFTKKEEVQEIVSSFDVIINKVNKIKRNVRRF